MHVAITGANGFIGQGLAAHILKTGKIGGKKVTRLLLLDLSFDTHVKSSPMVSYYAGDIADPAWLFTVLSNQSVNVVYHLASIPGGTAEKNYALAKAVNLDATLTLLELGKRQVERRGTTPVFVFASSIAVFGELTGHVTETTPLKPNLTYGAHKQIGEVLVEDFSRRGWVDGRSLRIPGVLARPPAPTGQLSAFLSDIIRELAAGREFQCPTSPGATTWASSLPCVVENLIHAATVSAEKLNGHRTFTLPTLYFSMRDLVEALELEYSSASSSLVKWQPDPQIERLFGRFPTLETPLAEAAGFSHDGDLHALVRNALPQNHNHWLEAMNER